MKVETYGRAGDRISGGAAKWLVRLPAARWSMSARLCARDRAPHTAARHHSALDRAADCALGVLAQLQTYYDTFTTLCLPIQTIYNWCFD